MAISLAERRDVAADSMKLPLYNVGKKSWSQLAASRFGFENRSHDGKYLYAEGYSNPESGAPWNW